MDQQTSNSRMEELLSRIEAIEKKQAKPDTLFSDVKTGNISIINSGNLDLNLLASTSTCCKKGEEKIGLQANLPF